MANFPTSISTNSNLYVAVNGLQTTLAVSISSSDTTITLTSSTGFPTTGLVTIDNSEVVSYTGISGANLTGCTRGADGTTAASHTLGVTVAHTIVAAHHNLLKDEVIAVETALGAGYAQASANTANAVVQRDGSGNFSAGTITASLTGHASADVQKSGDTMTGNLAFDDNSTHGIVGTSTNDDAPSGNVGYYVSASAAADTAFPATSTYGDFLSISVPAGDFDLDLVAEISQNGSTWTTAVVGMSTTSGNSSSGLVNGNNAVNISWASSSTTPVRTSVTISGYRFKSAGGATVYFKYLAVYSAGGPPTINGRINARRRR